MKLAARIIFVSLLFSIFNFQFSIPVSAQVTHSAGSGSVNPYAIPQTNPDVPQNMHTWSQTVFIEVLSAASCQLSGVDPMNPQQKCLGIDAKTGKIGFVENSGGAIGMVSKSLSVLFTPPIHTTDYFAYLGENFGITKKAYAADCDPAKVGVGFCGLTPLIKLWEAFRNIVYLVFIVVFVIVGLAIMLRLKIDPRTVMSIENQLPKLIIGILLVTFSFAIAGLAVDAMYVSIYLVYNTVSGANIENVDVSKMNPVYLQGRTVLDGIGGLGNLHFISDNIAKSVTVIFQQSLGIEGCSDPGNCLNNLFNPFNFIVNPGQSAGMNIIINTLSFISASAIFWNISHLPSVNIPLIGTIVSDIGKGITAFAASYAAYGGIQYVIRNLLPYLIVYIIILVAMLWALFRLAFELLKAYIYILLDVALAPFWIVAGLFPGSPVSFSAWLRDLLANLSAFPATIAMFLLGKVFIDVFNQTTTKIFVPPLVGNPTGGTASPLSALIGLGFILLTPQVLHMIKDLFKTPQLKYASAIGQAVSVGPAIVGGTTSAVFSPYGGLATLQRAQAAFGAIGKGEGIKGFFSAATGHGQGEVLPHPKMGGGGKG